MFNNFSIKTKLTLWHSLVIIIISLTLFISFYLLTNKYLIYETDRSLTAHSSQIANSIGSATSDIHSGQTAEIINMSQKEVPGMFVQVVDSTGLTLSGEKTQFSNLAIQALYIKQPQYTRATLNHTDMRIVAYPIESNNKIIGVVIMGHQIDVYENTLLQLRTVGILLLLFVILPTVVIEYLLTKAAIKPITLLSNDINKITSESLSRHIKVRADSQETNLLIKNFNSLLDRLNNSFNLEKQFLGEMAHEVKTPLTVIKSNTEVTLSRTRSIEEYQQSIQQVSDQIDKLTKNVVSLMDFAWAQSSDVTQTFHKFSLSNLLEELVKVAEYAALPKNIKVTNTIEKNIYILGKEEKLYQAIYNLIDNAVKFTPEKGSVDINLKQSGKSATIEIKDTGLGIAKDQIKNIFNRFYRTEQTKNIAGHGLGLAISESIIKAHGGKIEVQSELNKGSLFRVQLFISS